MLSLDDNTSFILSADRLKKYLPDAIKRVSAIRDEKKKEWEDKGSIWDSIERCSFYNWDTTLDNLNFIGNTVDYIDYIKIDIVLFNILIPTWTPKTLNAVWEK